MSISGAASEVGQTEALTGGLLERECTIDLTNGCGDFTLMKPSQYMESGHSEDPLPPTIGPEKSGGAKFKSTFTGCEGVFTYDLLQNGSTESTGKMAVMFSVPFDYICHHNLYAVGMFDKSTKCDEALYDLMEKGNQTTFVRGAPKDKPYITYEGEFFTIKATMSNSSQSTIKVEITQN